MAQPTPSFGTKTIYGIVAVLREASQGFGVLAFTMAMFALANSVFPGIGIAQTSTKGAAPRITVKKCVDFKIDGSGESESWKHVEWVSLNRRAGGKHDYSARFKMLYSSTGVYLLFDGSDQTLTATMDEDFLHLWTEDVFECFFWTNEDDPVYFEYEISPLGFELPILVPNLEGRFLGWRPWDYEGDRKTQKAISITGGTAKSLSPISNWRAEVFIPYKLLEPLRNVPPESGTRWRANFYRVDYDNGQSTEWDWARVGSSFHDFKHFGILVFE